MSIAPTMEVWQHAHTHSDNGLHHDAMRMFYAVEQNLNKESEASKGNEKMEGICSKVSSDHKAKYEHIRGVPRPKFHNNLLILPRRAASGPGHCRDQSLHSAHGGELLHSSERHQDVLLLGDQEELQETSTEAPPGPFQGRWLPRCRPPLSHDPECVRGESI